VNCGAALEPRTIEGRELEACPNDGFVLWHDPKVATAVVVEAGGGIVLGRRGIEPGYGLWCLPGGFVNDDEDPAQAAEFLGALGLTERGLPRLARACLDLLRLRTFFSIASREVRAWTVPAGTRAAEAAGRIHTDMERGFIRAEVVAARDLVASGSLAAARERGLVRLEGRAYEVQDGDVITFRFAA